MLLSLLATIFDGIRRKIMIERPVKYIIHANEKIMQGDFSVRIQPIHSINTMDGFDTIIDYINKMAEELAGTETLRTDFIANVSHELKTPLAIIQNYGTMLQKSDLSEETHIEYAKAITDASRRLANLITNILKLNRLENQQCEPRGRISLSLKTTAENAIVQISDTGCGISPEVGLHIFEKFYQGDTSHATQGNGLALVKRVRILSEVIFQWTARSEPEALLQLRSGEKRMENFKRILKKIFCLPPIPTVLIALPLFALVIFVLAANLKDTAFAYVTYVASAYAMIITVTGFPGIVRSIQQYIENHPLTKKIESHPLGGRFLKDVVFRTKISLYQGMFINFAYVAINLFWGISYRSTWFVSLSVYFVLLAAMRFLLLSPVNKNIIGQDMVSEFRRYRSCAVLLLLMSQALAGIVIFMVRQNRGYDYPGLQIYVMAVYAFYAVISAVVNLVRFRKHGSPVMSAAKVISLTAALVSMLSLETAMLAQFGADESVEYRKFMTGMTGAGVCAATISMAIFMLIRASKQLEKLQNNNS